MPVNANELHLVRVYDAPLDLVWEAWTNPEHLAKWWGPRGFTHTTKHKDFRRGGTWVYTMHGPDGTDWPNITTYHEVVPRQKLVYDHGGNEERPKLFTVTVLFSEAGGKTTLDMTMRFDTPEEARQSKTFIKQVGGNSTWDRLGEYLAHIGSAQDIFVINRSFAADRKTLYSMWADPVHLAKWLPPTGATMEFVVQDVKVGGRSRYAMAMGGQVMYGEVAYRELSPFDRLAYVQNFCDAHGTVTKPPFAPTWPDFVLTTVTFADEPDGETRVTVRWEIEGAATAEERATFLAERAGMTVGWTGSFDKLEAVLEAR